MNYMIAFADLTTGYVQPTVPVRLGDNYSQIANGLFSFDITGPTNVTIAVEQSSNLMGTWQTIETLQLTTGLARFTNTILGASQFYRARIVPP
jgi:hypothetical protein